MKQILWGLFCWIVAVTIVNAASFDCGKASTKVEKLICGDTELSRLDEDLSKAYQQSLERGDVKKGATVSQRQWLKNERNICQNAECIKAAYENRIKELGFTSSFGIVFMRPSGSSSSPPQTTDKIPEPQVAAPPVETQKTQAVQQQTQTSVADCGTSTISDATKLPKSKAVTQLIEISKAQFEKQQFECAVQSLDQANKVVRLAADGAERAAMGFEIKDVALGVIQQNKIADSALEKRLISAATQSIDLNGKLIKVASEDERFNDAAFYGRVADAKCADKGTLIKAANCEYKEFIIKMYQLDFTLPSTRHYVEAWQYSRYLQELSLSEIAHLWEKTPDDIRLAMEAALVSRLGQPIQSYVLIGIELMSPEKAKDELEGFNILQPAIERMKTKQSDFWVWWIYRYMAEAYWQAGDKEKSREILGNALNSIKTAKSAPAGRVNAFMNLATSMCKLIRDNGKAIQMCPIGIYDAKEMAALLNELEEMAKVTSNSYALGRAEVLRKRLPKEVVK